MNVVFIFKRGSGSHGQCSAHNGLEEPGRSMTGKLDTEMFDPGIIADIALVLSDEILAIMQKMPALLYTISP